MKRRITLLFLFLIYCISLWASAEAVNHTLHSNRSIIEQLAQLGPMAINPYLTIFITSLCSKLGIGNQFITTHPLFNNWFVLIASGVLLLLTMSIKLFGDKLNGPVRTAANFFDNKAALIINIIIVLAPSFMGNGTAIEPHVIQEAGFFAFSMKTVLILALSIYYLVVVMTVRLFFEILIFLSPIPLIDTIFEILKLILTIIFALISIFFPITALVLAILLFIISLLFYRKAKRTIAKTKYLVINPLIYKFRDRVPELTESPLGLSSRYETADLVIPAFLVKKYKGLKKKSMIWLVHSPGKGTFLHRKKLFLQSDGEAIDLSSCVLRKALVSNAISNEDGSFVLQISIAYNSQLETIADILDIDYISSKSTERESLQPI